MNQRLSKTLFLILLGFLAAALMSAGCGDEAPASGGDGGSDGDIDGDTDIDSDTEGFSCTMVSPSAVTTLEQATFSILGTHFLDGMVVYVTDDTTSDSTNLGPANVTSLHGAMVTTDAGQVPEGSYTVSLVNPNSETAECPVSLDWIAQTPPTLTDIDPPSAWQGIPDDDAISDQAVLAQGTGFEEVPMITWINVDDAAQRFPAGVVLFTDDVSSDAVCPSETASMPAGMYLVELANPSGLGAFWQDGGTLQEFEISGTPPPNVLDVDPFRSPSADDITLTIDGMFFIDGAVAQLILPDDSAIDLATTFVESTQLTAELPSNTVGQGFYPLRVTNPDGKWDIWYSYQATPSSEGHLDDFDLVEETLTQGRWRQGAVAGFDSFGGSYIYVAGGMDNGDLGFDGDVLDDIEIVPVSIKGEVSTPFQALQWNESTQTHEPNTLNEARHGLSLVRAGKWLYAVGGSPSNTAIASPTVDALDTVEKARIMGLEIQPAILSSSNAESGNLEAGNWYYRVSAVGSWGESVPSGLKLAVGSGGTVSITWTTVAGASSYNIYRNINPSGDGGEVYLLASGIAGPTFYDDGATTPTLSSPTPLPFGSLTKWVTLTDTPMTVPREGVDSVVITVPSGDEEIEDSTFLYAVGGRPDATGTS